MPLQAPTSAIGSVEALDRKCARGCWLFKGAQSARLIPAERIVFWARALTQQVHLGADFPSVGPSAVGRHHLGRYFKRLSLLSRRDAPASATETRRW
jgi:hypothetical protein